MRKILLAILLSITALLAAPLVSAYQPLNQACKGVTSSPTCDQAASQGTTNPVAGKDGVISITANVIALIAGAAAVVIIIVSGISYITANGNAEAINKSRQRIIGAVIGLVVVALAWAIISYVTVHIIK